MACLARGIQENSMKDHRLLRGKKAGSPLLLEQGLTTAKRPCQAQDKTLGTVAVDVMILKSKLMILDAVGVDRRKVEVEKWCKREDPDFCGV